MYPSVDRNEPSGNIPQSFNSPQSLYTRVYYLTCSGNYYVLLLLFIYMQFALIKFIIVCFLFALRYRVKSFTLDHPCCQLSH